MNTASFQTACSGSRDTATAIATDLCRHLQQCHEARGRWFGAAMLAEQIHGLVAPRFATTVAMAAVLLIVACAWS